jgi:hypothetical protein
VTTNRPEAGGLAIDTTGRSPEESVDLIASAVGWFNQPDFVRRVRVTNRNRTSSDSTTQSGAEP